MATTAYGKDYFAWQKDGATASAEVVLPLVLGLTAPASVIDVGCGTGAWLRFILDHGVADVLGVDGGAGDLVIPSDRFRRVDLEQPLRDDRRFDLAICLEVAEHLSPERGPSLVKDLCSLADVVLFSAAVPGQGLPDSDEHINERWQSYWASLFSEAGHATVDAIRPAIWDDHRVAWWYRQNAFLVISPSSKVRVAGESAIRDLVHPDLWRSVHPELRAREASLRSHVRALPRAAGLAVTRRLRRG
jgi:SAM-dependent methyltransferase